MAQMPDPKWKVTKAEMDAYLGECLRQEAQLELDNPDKPPNNNGTIIAALQTLINNYPADITLGDIVFNL
jgi:hypothetical protein